MERLKASTFTARVITSTLSDLASAVVGAIGALKGPLHGGANEAVLHIFDEIGSAENVVPWLDRALAEKRKIMGFGHRVYKRGDSRVPTMKAALDTLVEHYDRPEVAALYTALESEFVSRKGIYPNLDYPSGPAYNLMGFDTLTFTPLFIAARVTGWTAHIMEQAASNALIRPLSAYNGPAERHIEGYVADAAEAAAAERAEESGFERRNAAARWSEPGSRENILNILDPACMVRLGSSPECAIQRIDPAPCAERPPPWLRTNQRPVSDVERAHPGAPQFEEHSCQSTPPPRTALHRRRPSQKMRSSPHTRAESSASP